MLKIHQRCQTINSATTKSMNVYTIPCSFDNYSYLITCTTTGKALVIDPTEAYPILVECGKQGMELTTILCTHHHQDHVAGVEDLLAELPHLFVYGHRLDAKRIPGMNRAVKDGNLVSMGSLKVKVLHAPGHTDGSIVYAIENTIFTGDALFGAGCGRIFEGTAEQMYQSLQKITAAFPKSTKVFFGHEYTLHNLRFAINLEPKNKAITERLAAVQMHRALGLPTTPSNLELELHTNPFLRCNVPELVAVVSNNSNDAIKPLDVFTILRQMKDQLR